MCNNQSSKSVKIVDVYKYNDQLWCTLLDYNAICMMPCGSTELTFVLAIPNGVLNEGYYLTDFLVYKDKLLLVSYEASKLFIVDIQSKAFSEYSIRMGEDNARFHGHVCSGNLVYFIPKTYPAIVCVDLSTGEIHYIDNWINEFKKTQNKSKCYFRPQVAEVGDGKYYLISKYYNCVFVLDSFNKTIVKIEGDPETIECGASCVKEYENGLIFTYPSTKTAYYIKKTQKRKIELEYEMFEGKTIDFSEIIVVNDKIVFVPFAADCMTFVEKRDEDFVVISKVTFAQQPAYIKSWVYNDTIYCLRDEWIDSYDFEGNYIEREVVHGDKKFWEEIISNRLCEKKYLVESEKVSLNEYIVALS